MRRLIVRPGEAAELAARHVANGFRCIKVKVGLDPEEDVERVRAVRETVGQDVRIRVDANQGYERTSALRVCQEMEKFRLQWVEQPLPDWDVEGLAMLAQVLWTPIAVDESIYTVHDVYKIAKARAADVINIKVSICGGITSSLKIANAAASMGIPCFLGGCIETGVGTAAALHFAACAPNLFPAVELVGRSMFTDDMVKEHFLASRGVMLLPEKPGIGSPTTR